MKPAEQAQVNFIADFLRKGEVRNEVLARFGKKWQKVATRTFDRRLKAAQAVVEAEQDLIKEKAEEMVSKEAVELKSKILSSLERKVLLSDMAKGELETEVLLVTKDGIKKAKAKPTHAERRAAIAELNKMDGEYAPTKQDVKLTDNFDYSKLSDAAIKEIINADSDNKSV